jgi:hypothetical protein
MNGDPLYTSIKADLHRGEHTGLVPAAGITQRGDLVDVDRESNHISIVPS